MVEICLEDLKENPTTKKYSKNDIKTTKEIIKDCEEELRRRDGEKKR